MQYAEGIHAYEHGTEADRGVRHSLHETAFGQDLERRVWYRAGLARGMQAIALASGTGRTAIELARSVAPGRVVGLEDSDQLLAEARLSQRIACCDNVSFQHGDVYDLDPPEQPFDFAYARFLFQHLRDPVAVAENVLDVLKPGGRFCVVDIDDDWLVLHPRPSLFKAFTRWTAADQRRRGGDRNVGRKLGSYLREAGFQDVDTFVEVVTSQDVGIKQFLDVTTGLGRQEVSDEYQEFPADALDDIYSVLEEPYAWGALGIFVAVGRKP